MGGRELKERDEQEKERRLKEMLDDPVCGLCLHPDDTTAQSMYGEDLFYFCSIKSKEEFDKYPDKYGKKAQVEQQCLIDKKIK